MQIFISYAREDQARAQELCRKLEEAGFRPWLDTRDILPGEKWRVAIKAALEASDFVLVCLSSHSVEKRGFLQREIRDALDLRQEFLDSDIYLIPVRFEKVTVPEPLREFQWVDLFEEEGWPRLKKAIEVGMERLGLADAAATGEPPDKAAGLYHLEIVTPVGDRFEASAPAEALVGQLMRDFLRYWSPLSAEGSGRHRYVLTFDGGEGPQPLDPASTLQEMGVPRVAELVLKAEKLRPASPVALTIVDAQGERFTATVRLDTPVAGLARAFLHDRPGNGDRVRVELASGPPGGGSFRPLDMESSLFEQDVSDDALLRIYTSEGEV